MLQVTNLSKDYHGKVIFNNISFIIKEKEKVALLGQNGTGKTTLIQCLLDKESYSGDIKNTFKISLMEQETKYCVESFRDYLKEKEKQYLKKKECVEKKLEDPLIYEDQNHLDTVLSEYEKVSKDKIDIDDFILKKVITHFGFSLDLLNQPLAKLSGGEKTVLRLSECLAKNADLYILDEPTNHLDYRMLHLLDLYIQESEKTFLIVSHDRYFINNVATRILDIENSNIITYNCSYDQYKIQRKERLFLMQKERDLIEKKRKAYLDSSEEKRKWASKNGHKGMRVQADKLERQARLLPILPSLESLMKKVDLSLTFSKRFGDLVFSLKNCSKSYNSPILKDISFDIKNGERIAILGNNGSGKTTLLKILAQKNNPDEGTMQFGNNLIIGYFDQKGDNLPQNKTIFQFFEEIRPDLNEFKIKEYIKKFHLQNDMLKKKISLLSGGEKALLNLLQISLQKCNVLLLDEPTNHLDLEMRESLEKALLNFPGTIIFISHDRYFLEKIAQKKLIIKDTKITEHKVI